MAEDVLLLFHEAMIDHDPGPGHPERPERLRAVCRRLDAAPIPGVRRAEPKPAPRSAIERIHAPAYVDGIESHRGRSARIDLDTALSPGSVDAARLAAGAALEAAEAVVGGSARRVFALVRPPGHHAERRQAMGFCLFNNVAIAAAHATEALGLERVLIVDWDVHHGNGTQHAFAHRRDVLFFSVHRFPFYPGTGDLDEVGIGDGEGLTVNVPLPAGCGDAEYTAVFDRILAPIAGAYRPQLVLVSAGFDAHADDPLGGMSVTAEGFAALCGSVCDLAAGSAGGRLALVLEGGYDLAGLADSVHACVGVLAGAPPPSPPAESSLIEPVIGQVRRIQRRYWPILNSGR